MVTESITGQINTEFVKFNKEPENSVNLFADFNGRYKANIVSTSKLNENGDNLFYCMETQLWAKWMIITILSLTDQRKSN